MCRYVLCFVCDQRHIAAPVVKIYSFEIGCSIAFCQLFLKSLVHKCHCRGTMFWT